ncbi:MAG TPA: hypothetical protein VFY39_08415, partial [Gammaproteobacteria bacterium]|nr:hypothetical protein [Gammaproteobacteria bacterium]
MPPRARPALAAAAIFTAAFLLGAFVAAPYFVEHAIRSYAEQAPGWVARVDYASVNPFNLSVQLVGPELVEPEAGL